MKTRIEIDRLAKRSPAFLAAAFCWAFYVACLARAVFSDAMALRLFSSDLLIFYLAIEDALRGAPFSWSMPTNSYLFPDAALYFVFHFLFTADFRFALPATAFALGIVGVCGWIWLARWATGEGAARARATCAVLICGGALFLLSYYFSPLSASESEWRQIWSDIVWDGFYLFTPNVHGGAFALAPFCYRLFLECESDGFRRSRPAIALLALAALILASDRLFFAWFVAPAGLFLLWRQRFHFGRARRGLFLLSAIILSGVVLRETLFVRLPGVSGYVSPSDWIDLPGRFAGYLTAYIARNPTGFILWFLSCVVLIYFAAKDKRAAPRAVAAFLLTTMAAVALAAVVTGQMHARWQLPFWFAPQFAAALLLAGRISTGARASKAWTAAFALPLIAAIWAAPGRADVLEFVRYYPPSQECLDERARRFGLARGLAPYLIARRVSALTKADFRAVTVFPESHEYSDWGENWHNARGDNFNFVLIDANDSRDGDEVDKFVGHAPIARFNCGEIEARVYPPFSYLRRLSEKLLRPRDPAPPGTESPAPPEDANRSENLGRNWLMRILRKRRQGISAAAVDAALDAGAKLDARDWAGRSVLHYASRYGGHEIAAALIRAGAHVDAEDFLDRTPLHRAAARNFDTVSVLLNNGATIEARNILNETPLHAAARNLNCDSIRALVAAGADRDAKDWLGRTPRELAFSSLSEKPWLRGHFVSLCGFDSPAGKAALAARRGLVDGQGAFSLDIPILVISSGAAAEDFSAA